MTPKTGDAFDVKLTSVWMDAKALAETTGAGSVGCYYSLTDREPGTGEFKYLSQGTFLTGEVLSAFTILYRTQSSAEVTLVLRMLAEAKYRK